LEEALFGELSLEEVMDLSRDRQILDSSESMLKMHIMGMVSQVITGIVPPLDSIKWRDLELEVMKPSMLHYQKVKQ
jgi:hypothetical protein